MAVAGVLFDLDGVLAESEQVWDRIRHQVVTENHGAWREDSHRQMMGMSTNAWASYLIDDLGVQLGRNEVVKRVLERMNADYRQSSPLIPAAVEVVRELAARWPLAIASGSPLVLIESILEIAGIGSCFRTLVSSDDVAAGKPAPDVYLEAARRLGVPGDHCVVIEDSENGIRAGLAAGCTVIAVPNPTYPPDARVLSLAHSRLADIRELTPQLVSSLG